MAAALMALPTLAKRMAVKAWLRDRRQAHLARKAPPTAEELAAYDRQGGGSEHEHFEELAAEALRRRNGLGTA